MGSWCESDDQAGRLWVAKIRNWESPVNVGEKGLSFGLRHFLAPVSQPWAILTAYNLVIQVFVLRHLILFWTKSVTPNADLRI
jgi:hypothetical protein